MNSVFNNIKTTAEEMNQMLRESTDVKDLNFKFGGDIFQFFEVLHKLFEELNLLTTPSNKDDSKFRFINAYPDETYDDSNIITFDLVRRTPLIIENKIVRSNTKYIKPRFVREKFNDVTGNVENLYVAAFSNTISLNVFSNRARTVNEMARIIESIFYKYSSHIKKYVDEFVYIGTNSTQFTDRYNEKDRLFSREIQFNVITSEFYTLELEQLKSIDFEHK